jgi:Fe-S-cluster-containing dehydrogenase component
MAHRWSKERKAEPSGFRLPRRMFLESTGLILVAAAFVGCGEEDEEEPPWGVILSDPALCGNCRRCALTCSSLNVGEPSDARALVSPDRHFQEMLFDDPGWFASTCHMCPDDSDGTARTSPACVANCPKGAAQIACDNHPIYGNSRVRFIDPELCIGCGICVAVCPHSHPLLDPAAGKSHKCDLCIGRQERPPCVDACPASALCYYRVWLPEISRPFPWLDEQWEVPR